MRNIKRKFETELMTYLVTDPVANGRFWDVHVLQTNVAAVRFLQTAEDVAQLLLTTVCRVTNQIK